MHSLSAVDCSLISGLRMFEAGGYAHGIALIASVALIFGMVDLPFALYRTFVIKHVSVSIARV